MRRAAPPDLLPGTLDLLILRIVSLEPMHGYSNAQRLKLASRDVLQVGESSLYPALQRLLLNGYLEAEWGTSETTAGRATTPSRGQEKAARGGAPGVRRHRHGNQAGAGDRVSEARRR